MTFRPIDASREIGVTVNTIRIWCRTYSEFLSEGATVEGETRVLTSTDLEILRYIYQLRNEKLQRPQIAQRLSETTFGHIESFDSPQIGHELALPNTPESQSATPAPTVGHEYLIALERRLEAVEVGRKDFTQGIALGFIAALLFVMLLLALFALRNYL